MNTIEALLSLIDEVASSALTLGRAVVRIGTATIEVAIRLGRR